MLALLLFASIVCAIVFLLNFYINKRTGLKDAVFFVKCDGEAWIAETAWINEHTHQVHRIITTSHWQDGVLSILDNGETIYHSKQHFTDRQNLQRFHRIATTRFFYLIKWRVIVEGKRMAALR
jgi:hypothetical protein